MAKLLRNDPTFEGSINDLRFPVDDHHQTAWMLSNAEWRETLPSYRTDLPEIFAGRLHSLMGYKPSTIEDALY